MKNPPRNTGLDILRLVKNNPLFDRHWLKEKLHLSIDTIYQAVRRLTKRFFVKREATGGGRKKKTLFSVTSLGLRFINAQEHLHQVKRSKFPEVGTKKQKLVEAASDKAQEDTEIDEFLLPSDQIEAILTQPLGKIKEEVERLAKAELIDIKLLNRISKSLISTSNFCIKHLSQNRKEGSKNIASFAAYISENINLVQSAISEFPNFQTRVKTFGESLAKESSFGLILPHKHKAKKMMPPIICVPPSVIINYLPDTFASFNTIYQDPEIRALTFLYTLTNSEVIMKKIVEKKAAVLREKYPRKDITSAYSIIVKKIIKITPSEFNQVFRE